MEKELKYQVGVSNIGTVYEGNNYRIACKHYAEYKRLIKANYGRLACEMVYILANGCIDKEYYSKDYNFDI